VLPCISPWGYETVNRWNPDALDPNREFKQGSTVAESAQAMACVADTCGRVDVHIDLYETKGYPLSSSGRPTQSESARHWVAATAAVDASAEPEKPDIACLNRGRSHFAYVLLIRDLQ
jgi:hypothetical protein